ncbi:MAG: hypothetical protein R3E09_03245 [Novosphingobium sp.]|nr:hypothetical protein [Novosphingobium sp.]
MAQDIQRRIVQPVAAPQQFPPPTARELRTQAVHRLQVGLLGLAGMLLLVGLANIVMDRAREVEQVGPATEESGQALEEKKPAADPLADIGVVPAADPSPTATASPSSESEAIE